MVYILNLAFFVRIKADLAMVLRGDNRIAMKPIAKLV